MKAKELLVSAGSLLLAGLILVVAGNAVAPAAAANAAAEQQEMMETLLPGSTVFTPEEDHLQDQREEREGRQRGNVQRGQDDVGDQRRCNLGGKTR